MVCNVDNYSFAQDIKTAPSNKSELKPCKHASKIFFNYSKLFYQVFRNESTLFIPQDASRTNSCNTFGRNSSKVIP